MKDAARLLLLCFSLSIIALTATGEYNRHAAAQSGGVVERSTVSSSSPVPSVPTSAAAPVDPLPPLPETPRADQLEPQLVFPGRIVEVYDGDTPTVEVCLTFRARLLDCWAPEIKGTEKAAGVASREHLAAFALNKPCIVRLPLHGTRLDHVLTFGRPLCFISVDGVDLSEFQVSAGHATKTKQ